MKLLIILSICLHVQGGVIKEECEGIVVNDIYHDLEELKTELDRPYLLAVEYLTNTLYFSYSVNKSDDESKTASLNLNTLNFKDIADVNDGFAQAVDRRSHWVYIGGSDGIYRYDYNNDKAELYAAKGSNIWTLFAHKDVLYYSEFPSQFLYTISDGEVKRFKDLEDTKVDHFIIDQNDEMFYTNATGIYIQKYGTKNATLIKETEDVSVRVLTLDTVDDMYACLNDGIYKLNKVNLELEHILEIEDAFGVAFDNNNNLIYADATQIIRLKPNKEKSCSE